MSTNLKGGTINSFNNTPIAKDDLFLVSEDDSGGVITFDVMGNDLAGNAKSLWSLDNGEANDLIAQDTGRAESMSTDKSALGANIWITSDGKVGYNSATLSGLIQSLGAGEKIEDSFVYAIRVANGTLSWATAKIVYTGTNDKVVITSAPAAGTVIEDTQPSTSGTINFTDPDIHDLHTASFTAGPNATNYGDFSLTGVVQAANSPNGSVGWNYTLNSSAQALAQGESHIETFNVTISDGSSTTTQTTTITIYGTNDAPDTQGASATVLEDQVVTGQVTATDIDHGASWTFAAATPPSGFSMDADGKWSFDAGAYDYLGQGETAQVVVNYVVTDEFGATDTDKITITVVGVDDQSALIGTAKGKVVESTPKLPGIPTATGTLSIIDPDGGSSFVAANGVPTQSGFGTFTVDASGHWTYNLDNSNPTVNGLPDGGHLVDTFVVQTTDGTTKTISIDIFGANDFTPPSTYTGTGDANDFDDLVGSGAANNSATILGDNTLADNITGGSSGQNIDGRGGDDFIFAGGGDDTVVGNAGNDTLYGQAGNDNVSGSNGLDAVYGGSGNDQLNGGNDADALYGGSGNDFLGGAGGDDLLVGGFGSDRMIGGQGADTFRMLDLRDTNDRIEDFVFGTDTLDLQALDADSAAGGNQTFAWGGGTATAHGVWLVQDGANTIVYADTDGNLDTAEFAVTLLNVTYADPLASPPPNFLL